MSHPQNQPTPAHLSRTPQPNTRDPEMATTNTMPMNGAFLAMSGQNQSPAGPPALTAAPTAGRLWYSFRRCWFSSLLIALLGATATVLIVMQIMPAVYTAVALVEVKAPPHYEEFGEAYIDPKLYREDQKAMVTSTPVLRKALNDESVAKLAAVQDKIHAITWLNKNIKADYKLGPGILRIYLQDGSPEGLEEIVNAVAEAYVEDAQNKIKERRKAVLDELEQINRDLEQKLQTKKDSLNQILVQRGLPTLEEEKRNTEILLKSLETANKKAQEINLEVRKYESALEQLNKQNSRTDPKVSIESFLKEDEILKGYRDKLAAINAHIQFLKTKATAKVQRQYLGEYIEKRNDVIDLMNSYQKTQLQLALSQKKQSQKYIEDEIDRLRNEIRKGHQNRSTPDVEQLRAKIKTLEGSVKESGDKITKLKVIIAKGAHITFFQEAERPRTLDRTRQIKYAGASGLGVFGLLLFGVTLLEFNRRKINTVADVTNGLGVRLVGTIPSVPRKAQATETNGSKKNTYHKNLLTESIDSIRTQLLHTATAEGLQVLMVTSAYSGEGKTSFSSQLAASLARAWKKTLLVDGDMRNPAIHTVFNLPVDPGFSEVLRGEVQPAEVIQTTSVSRLWVMPAGQWDSHSVQALAQDGVRTTFDELKEEYDFIVVDSCPLLPVADSLLLAHHVDATCFTVLREVSRAPAVHLAQQKLANLGVRCLGAVLIGGKAEYGSYKYNSFTRSL